MGLIKCSDCHNNISDSAPTCPICGRHMGSISVVRKGGKYELIGSLLIIAGIFIIPSINPILAGVFTLLGFVIFIAGRFM